MSSAVAAETARMGYRRALSRASVPYLLIGPTVLMVLFLMGWPLISGIWLSLTNYKVGPLDKATFVGLNNYVLILTSKGFWQAGLVTLKFLVMCVVAEMPLGLGLALLLNRDVRGIGIIRALCIIPLMVPNVVSAMMFRMMLDPYGVVNWALRFFGLWDSHFPWMASPNSVLWGFLVLDVWMMTPQVTILLLAGLQGVPREVEEAATVDGATTWQRFQHVIFPLVMPFFLISFMVRCIQLIQVFDVIYVLTQGGPANASLVLHMDVYREGFTAGYFGIGIAYGYILAAIVLVVVLLIARRYMEAQQQVYGEA